jgi:protein TonB
LNGYASANVVAQTDPSFMTHRFNTIPVRVIVGKDGSVKHVHVLYALPEQSQSILAALRTWRFKPYRVDGRAVAVETGLRFGAPAANVY